jgi:outer membrane receptor protein involved in Fe transport
VPGAVDTRRGVRRLSRAKTGARWFGHLQVRHVGPRPLVEDNSRSAPLRRRWHTLRVGYRLNRDVRLALDVFNLFDRKASDIEYFYASRLRGEAPGGVEDRHFHPVEPRSARLTLTTNF